MGLLQLAHVHADAVSVNRISKGYMVIVRNMINHDYKCERFGTIDAAEKYINNRFPVPNFILFNKNSFVMTGVYYDRIYKG